MSGPLRYTGKSHEVDILFRKLGWRDIDQIAIANEIRKVIQPERSS